MCHAKFVSILGIVWCISSSMLAQDKSKADTGTPAVTPVTVGQEMFRAYCASCHGLDAKGNGPASPALRNRPPDLTQLSKRNGGKFPSVRVATIIQGDQFITAHGSREMPIWGEAFRNVNRDEALAKLKVHNLTLYIESVQQK